MFKVTCYKLYNPCYNFLNLLRIMKEQKLERFKNHWIHSSVVYQIYPLSFKDSNADGKGDLGGIIEKLDYLNDGKESLGIKAVWISPVYKSPMIDGGYDISDYYDIDPLFGDIKTFDRLVSELHRRKMKLIVDLVGNHTSFAHPWFVEARSSRDNPKRDWYIWKDPKPDGSPPNNWLSVFGGSAWIYEKASGQYCLHSFMPTQPDLNWKNPEVQSEMKKIMEFWIGRGVDGFRVDALYHFIEDSLYRDDPPNPDFIPGDDPYKSLLHIHSKGQAELPEAMKIFREIIAEHKDIFIVSEVYAPVPKLKEMYAICPGEQYAPFNFNLIGLPWKASAYKKSIDEFEKVLVLEETPTYVLGNHDLSRVRTRLGKECSRLAAFLLFTLRGVPFVYYGDEIGMKDEKIPYEKVQDAAERETPGFQLGRDPGRTPMQWDDSQYAGFSAAEPWLPLGENWKTDNVKSQDVNPKSILSMYRTLIHFRNGSIVLQRGKYVPLTSRSEDVFSFLREYGNERLLVVANFSNDTVEETLPNGQVKIIVSSYLDRRSEEVSGTLITLRPQEGYLLEITK